jgi:hypothetical protein
MDGSPYTPGAGHRPPVLAGRQELVQAWRTGLNDVAATGRQRAPDMVLTAPRGVGKTAAVLEFQDLSQRQGFEVVRLQAASGNAGLVDSLLRRARARAEAGPGPWQRAKRAFDRVSGVTLPIVGGGVSFNEAPQAGMPSRVSPEDLADALATLAREVRKDREAGGVLITVDEIQAADRSDLTLLAAALQGLNAEYPDARVMFAASGLPQTFQVLIDAGVTHPDRLFRFRQIPLVLSPDDARYAVVEAARQVGVAWEPEAADMIVQTSRGYPAHLQVFADATWLAATGPSIITADDARAGIAAGAQTLERESLGPRFDGLTDRERELLTALAVNGGQSTSAVLALTLGRTQQALSQVRDALITKGDVYVPRRGELALTVPVFAPYLLSNYEPARDRSSRTGLLALTEMQLNLQALHERTASRSGLPQPGGGPRAVRAQPPPRPSSQPHSLPGPAAAPEIPAPAGPDIDL